MREIDARRRWHIAIPVGITALRTAITPLLFFSVRSLETGALALLLLVILTDLLDGYLARKLGVVSSCGAYADVTADFLCILASFTAFVSLGLYPFWILLLIVSMFAQFLLTSRQGHLVYDPIGKYYGAFLFIGIGLTLMFPKGTSCQAVLVILVVLTVVSLLSRILARLKPTGNNR